MCFIKIIDFNKCSRYSITEILNKDMVVIKVLQKRLINRIFFKEYNYYSPCMNYKYIKGKLNISPLGVCIINGSDYSAIEIDKGFHSFRSKEDITEEFRLPFSNYVLCKCIIPKGSTIVYNDSEIVSNQIIFIEELK